VSPRVKLCAFGLLLVAMFLAARAAGLSLGPVTTTYSQSAGTSAPTGPGMPGMNMFPSSRGSGRTTPAPAGSATPPGESATPSGEKEPR
jgi:hypothetical protein